MKKTFCLILVLSSLLTLKANATTITSPSAAVSPTVVNETIEYLENGDSIITTIVEDSPLVAPRASTYSKQGSKTTTYKNSSGSTLWSLKVNGTFTVKSGSSATCTNSTHSVTINSPNWKKSSSSASKSGNTASAKATMNCYNLGFLIQTINRTVTLSCNSNGGLS